ncbi:MAG: flagellar biosynthetic protein FliO [Muribaculaceae bacterium]|nr:flagellar biosynthetic protein FliO [Muribaculaceae bacterium]
MSGYVINFTVYTMAMIGLICFAVFIYKKIMDGGIRADNSKFLSLEESMNLSPRKTLHVVRAGNERFLIASDVDRTTLISKLGTSSAVQEQLTPNFEDILKNRVVDIAPVEALKSQNMTENTEPMIPRRNRPPRRKDRAASMTVEFPKSVPTGRSTMQEMAKRINEL